ncbi:flippase-like domain-containing protein [Nanchangia anserum]|uniref:lysylphosphatidylglycerol synthase transmembrane domain-containing protein n=1 Tax=Nanchangia anserum TaxID=2692125 RepID=UPI0018836960|nr:lysylphosphatidylglycerol synthase transmembrane domain-containing protein [Nanchangia anserum]QOX81803.1 flippase-like domain-containing protein [Nanchangia anserum]
MSQAAQEAGVRGPRCIGVTRAESSYACVFEVGAHLRPLSDIDAEVLSDDVLDDLWQQLRACHTRGLTHRNIDASSLALSSDNLVNLRHWDQGEVAASDLAQRVDLVQALILTCLLVGEDRAVASARRVLGDGTLTSLLPMLQMLALPTSTRSRAKAAKLLPRVRETLRDIAQVESFDVPAVDLRGFSIKTLLITTVGLIALVVVFSSLNFTDLISVLSQATWWWLIVGFFFSLLNAPAQTIILKGVCPERLGWRECTAVQLAGSLTSLVAPTGVGVAALNLRYLNKQRVPTALALATVSLMQAFQFVVTVALLMIFVGFTGTSISVNFFSGPLLWAVIVLAVIVGVFFAITPTRVWALKKLSGPISQVWPRLVWVMGSPRRILIATAGVVVMVLTQVACFGCSLAAFGETLSFSSLAVTFLVSNTVGSLIPTPGGLGPIEASLTGGLQLAGIGSAVALSAALTYRLLTFWGRAPIGWLALKYLQRCGIL